MTLRLPGTAKEAAIRLVGQIGGEPGRYVYGVAFVDPDPDFWPMEFPPPDPFEPASLRIGLECSLCQARAEIQQADIEEDVYAVNGNILRYCAECGTSTPWKKAEGEALPASTASAAKPSISLLTLAPPLKTSNPSLEAPVASLLEAFEPVLDDSSALASGELTSSYSAASTTSEFVSLTDIQTSPVVASAVLLAPEPAVHTPAKPAAHPAVKTGDVTARQLAANGRPVNKRRHVRITVSFSACVRHPAHADQVVECENVSKAGVCFHSLQQYPLDSFIEVAAPFSPGETALFVPAQIKRVETLSGGLVFRYGVEYTKFSAPHPYGQSS